MNDDPVRLVDAEDAPPYLVELVRGLEPPPLPPSVRERTRDRLERSRRPRRWRTLGPSLAVAAAVAIGIAAYLLAQPEEEVATPSRIQPDAPREEPPRDTLAVPEPEEPKRDEPVEVVAAPGPEETERARDDALPGSRPDPTGVEQCDSAAGDSSRCVIEALEGRARTAHDYRLLIEAYRSVGNEAAAHRHMRTFVQRWAAHPTARMYQQILIARGAD